MSPRHNSVPCAVQEKQERWFAPLGAGAQHGVGSARGRIGKLDNFMWIERATAANQDKVDSDQLHRGPAGAARNFSQRAALDRTVLCRA
jgi:hypothetical protein